MNVSTRAKEAETKGEIMSRKRGRDLSCHDPDTHASIKTRVKKE